MSSVVLFCYTEVKTEKVMSILSNTEWFQCYGLLDQSGERWGLVCADFRCSVELEGMDQEKNNSGWEPGATSFCGREFNGNTSGEMQA